MKTLIYHVSLANIFWSFLTLTLFLFLNGDLFWEKSLGSFCYLGQVRPWAPLQAISDHDFVSQWRFDRFFFVKFSTKRIYLAETATKVKYVFLHLCLLQFSGIGVNLGRHSVYSGNICDASFLNRSICCTICAHSCTVCD